MTIDRPVSEQSIKPQIESPIKETFDSVSYLGVRLPKSQNRESTFVPKREQYTDFIEDRFSLNLEKDIAVSLLQGDPLLIEGGTSIGKTTTVRKMASDLGWEVHYANLNGATDVEDLMGRYIPNPNKNHPEDPEYVFVDGKVTSGLRQETGKTKVIILDEFNSAAPNILIRLHEVLDSLQRGENVVLSEDASESIPVDKSTTKIVALMNPPGKGYFGREPLDPAQLRRWVYLKAPSDLPEETFSYSTDALFSLVPQQQEVSDIKTLPSRESALLPEQLQEIPGISEILSKYKEFHQGAKKLVKERKVAADQPQPFIYDDRMEPKRVRDFVLAFYNGDINETFKSALNYYYVNKLDSNLDRQKLQELIRHVEYIAPQNTSQRRGVDRETTSPAESKTIVSTETLKNEQAAWKKVLGVDVEVPPLPDSVTPEVREKLKDLGMELRFIPDVNLGTLADIKRDGVDEYLKNRQRLYPNWHKYETLTDSQKEDHSIGRNLEEWYWNLVKDEKVPFPQLPGKWIAVETMPKPKYGDKYSSSQITDELGLEDRFNVTWNDANKAINEAEGNILAAAGLPIIGEQVRMLEAIEWNLLANREGWGKTNTYEWTNTELRDGGVSDRVIVGYSDSGGAAYAIWYRPGRSYDRLGFRLAVVL
ncbi:MAG TPA: AAA family ATPase [Patescibacteria group bacterium]|nr:AAA family ATPase [Patescibacteria group bacterium]